MKKLFITALFIITTFSVSACEICGCGVGNFYMGLLPNFRNHFIGLRYHYMHYHTQLANDKTQFSNDYYNTIELWTGWNIGKKWQLIAFVPYQINKQYTDDGIKNNCGLGDVTLLANYTLLHSLANKNERMVDQQLSIGGGVTLPTGSFKVDVADPNANIGDVNSQSGTGSTGFIMNAAYNVTISNFGVSASANYKINPANENNFKFGNRFTANTFAWYRIRTNGFGISPNIGILYEHAAANQLLKTVVEQTGGYATLGSAGVEINYNKIAVGVNTQAPLKQNFSNGQTQLKLRGLVHVTFAL